jgi:metal-responsive CopG/Arc/MetJ family transcriptional regulator
MPTAASNASRTRANLVAKKSEPKQITTMRLSPNVLRRLERISEQHGCTRSALINQFIVEGLRREERQPKPEPEVTLGALD